MVEQFVHPDHERLQAFHQGRLDDDSIALEIAAHLDACAECRRTIESLPADTLEQLVRSVDTTPTLDRPPTHAPIPASLEYFRILGVLGEGGMGTVYRADDTRLHRAVAIKTLRADLAQRPGAKDRFLREARSAAALQHDHVIPIYYVGEEDGTPFLAMPLLQGMPLDRYLKQSGGKLSPESAVSIVRQVAAGLAAAHQIGLIHRDIKPGNIWIETAHGDRAKILDFGLARSVRSEAQLTDSGAVIGTPAYMAPEQARGQAVDGRADLFSLGCVLYELLTGKRPFTGSDVMAILTSLAVDTPEEPRRLDAAISAELSQLTMQLLSKHPDQRPASANEVEQRLLAIQVTTARPKVETLNSSSAAPVHATIDNRSASGPWDRLDPTVDPVPKPAARMRRPFRPHASEPTAPTRSHPRFRKSAVISGFAAVLLILIGGGGFALYKLTLQTKEGTLLVEVDTSADVRFANGELRLFGEDGNLRYTLKPGVRSQSVAAGTYTVLVAGSDGLTLNTDKFEMQKDGKIVIRVTAAGGGAVRTDPTADTGKDLDRRTAEWVLSMGGKVQVNGVKNDIKVGTELPKTPFRLSMVNWDGIESVVDADLSRLNGLNHLSALNLAKTGITDAAATQLKSLKRLGYVNLNFTAVTDSALSQLRDLDGLTILELYRTSITDRGVGHLKNFPELRFLHLGRTKTTDAGLEHLKSLHKLINLDLSDTRTTDQGLTAIAELKALQDLSLNGTPVTDAGLVRLKNLPELKCLDLSDTKVTPAGLDHLKDVRNLETLRFGGTAIEQNWISLRQLRRLEELDLHRSAISDAGLLQLAEASALRKLRLTKTKVTADGIDRLRRSLPQCRVEWDGGVIEARVIANAYGMKFSLVPRGKSWIGGGGGKPGDTPIAFDMDFYIGSHPVTQEQWQQVTGTNPAHFSRNGFRKSAVSDVSDADLKQFPVEGVSYADVGDFLDKLNKLDPLPGWKYRLPTSAEWEYACRGGPLQDRAESAFHFYAGKPSNSLPPDQANYAHVGGRNRTVKVGSFAPNSRGLYDMHGLVLEWCSDSARNLEGQETRLARGGSWNDPAGTAASSLQFLPTVRYASLGLRIVRAPVKP